MSASREPLRILFCDDSGGALEGCLREVAAPFGERVHASTAASVEGFRGLVQKGEAFDVVVSDLNFEQVGGGPKDGLVILGEARAANRDVETLLVTAYAGSLSFAEGLGLAATGLKPENVFTKAAGDEPRALWARLRERLAGILQARSSASERLHDLERESFFHRRRSLEETVRQLAQGAIAERAAEIRADPGRTFHGIVGQSFALRDALARLERAARRQSDVLLQGETGTGKELCALALHECSPRKAQPFVRTDLAALSRELIPAELFGHERGAFTGALRTRRGLLVEANGGTIFFDEIGNLPADVQAGMLRVLQERTFRPLGADRDVKVDVVVVAATNSDLETAVRQGRFRGDLLERLAVVPVTLAPLRERREDLPLLAVTILDELRTRFGVPGFTRIEPEALDLVARHPWPRNVRQLKNALERLFSEFDEKTDPIAAGHVRKVLPRETLPEGTAEKSLPRRVLDGDEGLTLAQLARRYGEDAVREVIEETFLELHGPPNDELAARLFGGMRANSWRQFAFTRGLTYRAVKSGGA